MTKTKRLISGAVFILASSLSIKAHAEFITLTSYTLWSNTYNANFIRITDAGTPVNPSGCTDLDSYMVLSTLSKEAQSRIFATLLTAKALNKPVQIFVSGCEQSRPAIQNVTIN